MEEEEVEVTGPPVGATKVTPEVEVKEQSGPPVGAVPVKKKDESVPNLTSSSASPEGAEPVSKPSEKNTESDSHLKRLQKFTQIEYQDYADKRKKELETEWQKNPTDANYQKLSKQYDQDLSDKEADFNQLLTKFGGIYEKRDRAQLEKQAKEDFQKNKERNPATTAAKALWGSFRYQIPAGLISSNVAMQKAPEDIGSAFYRAMPESIQKFLDETEPANKLGPRKNFEEPEHLKRRKSMMLEAYKLQNQGQEYTKDLVSSLDKADDFVDYVNWAGYAIGQGVGQIPVAIATKGASSYGQEIGSIYMDGVSKIAQEKGISEQEVIEKGLDDSLYPLVFGVAAGKLDYIGAKGVADTFGKKEIMGSLRDRAIAMFKSVGKTGGKESLTEAGQTLLEQIGVSKSADKTWEQAFNEVDPEQIREAAAQGGVAGTALAGAGAATTKVLNAVQKKAPTIEVVKQVLEKTNVNDKASMSKDADVIQDKVEEADVENNPKQDEQSIETTATAVEPGANPVVENGPEPSPEGLPVDDVSNISGEPGGNTDAVPVESGNPATESQQPTVEELKKKFYSSNDLNDKIKTFAEVIASGDEFLEEEDFYTDNKDAISKIMYPDGRDVKTDKGIIEGELIRDIRGTEIPEGLYINNSELFNEDDIGKGYGKELYKKALHEHGIIYSGKAVSKQAKNVHKSLVKSGDATLKKYPKLGLTALISTKKNEQKSAATEVPVQSETTTEQDQGTGEPTSEVPVGSDVAESTTTDQVGQEPPPPPDSEKQLVEDQEASKRRAFTQQILDDPNISDEVKNGLSEDAKNYIPKGLKITQAEAKAIIQSKGTAQAQADFMDRSNGMDPDVRVAIGENLIRQYNQEGDIENAIKVADNVAKYLTDLGRAVNAAKIFQMLTPAGMLKYVAKEVQKSKEKFDNQTESNRKKSKAAVDKINQDAVEKILNDPTLSKSIAEKVKRGSVKKAIDFLEGLKIDTGNIATAQIIPGIGLLPHVWNAAIGIIQDSLKAGLTISQAINKAVNKIKEKKIKDFDETKFREMLNEKLKGYKVTLDPEAAIKEELKANGTSIDEIVRQHYDAQNRTKTSLADKLTKDAGLNADEAHAIAKEIINAFDNLTKAAKEKALKKLLPKDTKKRGKRQELIDQIIQQSNLGGMTDQEYRDAIADKLGVPDLTEEQGKKITDLADKVQKAPEGFAKNRATEELLTYVAGLNKLDWKEVGMAIWYANILSGVSTQVLNISANFAEAMGDAYVLAMQNPKQAPWIWKGLFEGYGRGALEALDLIKTGNQPTKLGNKITEAAVLERVNFKGGNWNPYNYLKYVSRLMNGADIIGYQGIKEMRARQLAVSMAIEEGKNNPDMSINDRAGEILNKGQQSYNDAIEEAKAEGFTGNDVQRRAMEILEAKRPELLVQQSSDAAARGTFNYEPEGALGWLTMAVNGMTNMDIKGIKPLKFIIPFTRIIANVANRYLDWSPWGLARAAKGGIGYETLGENRYRKYSPQEKTEQWIKAITGTTAMAAIYALTDDEEGVFQITADGPGDVQKKFQLQETGWRPYSIRIGDKWYNYQNTPLAIPFSTVGFYRDLQKYRGVTDEEDLATKFGIVAHGTAKYMMDLTFLQSLSSFFDSFSKENPNEGKNFFEKQQKTMERVGKSFVIPNAVTQISRAIQEVADMPMKKAESMGDQIIRDLPILRDHLGNIYNALGDPVIPSQIEKFVPLKPSKAKDDEKLWNLIIKNNAWISKPGRTTLKPTGKPMTDEEYDTFSLKAAQLGKRLLSANYARLNAIKDKERAKEEIGKLINQARSDARDQMFGRKLF